MQNFYSWCAENNIIEEGICFKTKNDISLDITRDNRMYDVVLTQNKNSFFFGKNILNTSYTEKHPKNFNIVDSLYAPFIIYDDTKVLTRDNNVIDSGSNITTPLYHAFKNDLKNENSDTIHDQLDKSFIKTNDYTKYKNLEKLTYSNVDMLISIGCNRFYKQIEEGKLPSIYTDILYPDSKSSHVLHIGNVLKHKLRVKSQELTKLTKKQPEILLKMIFNNIDDTNPLKQLTYSCINSINNITTTKGIVTQINSLRGKFISNALNYFILNINVYKIKGSKIPANVTNQIDTLFSNISYSKNIETKTTYDKTLQNKLNNTVAIDSKQAEILRKYQKKFAFILTWLYSLILNCSDKHDDYNAISSANTIRKNAIDLFRNYISKIYKREKQPLLITSDDMGDIDVYSHNYYNDYEPAQTITTTPQNIIDVLLIDDNINLGSTVFELTWNIKQSLYKRYPNATIRCHWFVLFMPINDYNKIYSKNTNQIEHTPSPLTIERPEDIQHQIVKNKKDTLTSLPKKIKEIFKIADENKIKDIINIASKTITNAKVKTYKTFDDLESTIPLSNAISYNKAHGIHYQTELKLTPEQTTCYKILKYLTPAVKTINNDRRLVALQKLIGINSLAFSPDDKVRNTSHTDFSKNAKPFIDNINKHYNEGSIKKCYEKLLTRVEDVYKTIKNNPKRTSIENIDIYVLLYAIYSYLYNSSSKQIRLSKRQQGKVSDYQFAKYIILCCAKGISNAALYDKNIKKHIKQITYNNNTPPTINITIDDNSSNNDNKPFKGIFKGKLTKNDVNAIDNWLMGKYPSQLENTTPIGDMTHLSFEQFFGKLLHEKVSTYNTSQYRIEFCEACYNFLHTTLNISISSKIKNTQQIPSKDIELLEAYSGKHIKDFINEINYVCNTQKSRLYTIISICSYLYEHDQID